MYSLDINFLKDRQAQDTSKIDTATKPTQISLEGQIPMLIGLGVMVGLLGLVAGFLWFLNWQTAKTQANIQALEAELGILNAQTEKITQVETKIQTINNETKALVTVFNQIKPWSAILQEIRDQIPSSVQIQSIKQATVPAAEGDSSGKPKIQITISGYAGSYQGVNDFLLNLQASKFLQADKTQLTSAQLAELPIAENTSKNEEKSDAKLVFPKGVQYTITTQLNDLPASQLRRELASKGAVGLVTRLSILEQKGAINP
jgi:type IV pilus assembly protein PilN